MDSDDENPFINHGPQAGGARINILPGIPALQFNISTMQPMQPPGQGSGAPTPGTPAEISDMVLRLFSSMLGDRAQRQAAARGDGGQPQPQGQHGEGHQHHQHQHQQTQTTTDGHTTTTTTTSTSTGGPHFHGGRFQFTAGPTITTRVVRIERNSNTPLGTATGGTAPPLTPRTERGEAEPVEELNA